MEAVLKICNVAGNYRSCWLENIQIFPVFLCWFIIPMVDKVQQKPSGTKNDVYLVAPFLITLITITSFLPGTTLMVKFSQTKPSVKPLWGLFCMVEIYQPARQSKGDLAVFTATGGRGREKQRGARWVKTIIQNLPESFLEASSLLNSPGWMCT